jgi:hypothetical protein
MDFRDGLRAAAVAGMALCVAGCGGSSTGSAPSFQELGERFIELDDAASGQPLTADMPVSGTARYFGRGGFLIAESLAEPAGPEEIETFAFGRVELTADFSNSRVSGSMTDFRDQNDAQLPGTLNVSSGPIIGASVPLVDVDGTLIVDGVSTTFDMTGAGEFRGPSARFFRAQYEGTATDAERARLAGGELVVREPQQ